MMGTGWRRNDNLIPSAFQKLCFGDFYQAESLSSCKFLLIFKYLLKELEEFELIFSDLQCKLSPGTDYSNHKISISENA